MDNMDVDTTWGNPSLRVKIRIAEVRTKVKKRPASKSGLTTDEKRANMEGHCV